VPGISGITKIACAEHHSLFLCNDSSVWSVGRGEDGRLGHGDLKNCEAITRILALDPAQLPHGDRVVDIAAGECHSLAVTQQGRLYAWGYGDLLQLGQGVEQDEPAPVLLTSQQIDEGGEHGLGRAVVQAAGGSQHSVILTVARTQPAPGKVGTGKVTAQAVSASAAAQTPAAATAAGSASPAAAASN